MTRFYTAVTQYGNSMLCKEIVDGKSRIRKIPYKPSLYTKLPATTESQYHTMEGHPLKRNTFENIDAAKEYVKRYKDVDNHEFFGNTNWLYQFICDEYPGPMDIDLSQLGVWTLDIETEVEHLRFPEPAIADERLLLITMLDNRTKKYWTWGLKPFNYENALKIESDFDISKIDYEYRYFPDEADMLKDFLFWWKNAQIDCLTNWNGESFDVPYLVNRISNVLGDDAVLQLSPFRIVRDRTVPVGQNEEFITYDLQGIAHLDYLQLYKKFGTYSAKESYKLDFIGQEELGIRKIELEGSFRDSYQDAVFDRFVVYNWRDCDIVDRLEDKMALIQLAYTIAYDAKCLPNDVFSPVKTWDCMMYRFMLEKNIIVPQKKHVKKWQIEGAFVKEPVPGQYKWIASVDAASLYPTIIMQYNMSPETMLNIPMRQVTVDGLLNKEYDLSDLKDKKYGMTANGQYFRNDVEGLFPEIVSKQFADRKMYKKKMQVAEAELELVKAEMKKRGLEV